MRKVVVVLIILLIIINFHEARGGCNDYEVSMGRTLFQSHKTTSKVLRIGALGTLEAIPSSVPLLNFAVNVINNRSDLLPDVHIDLSSSNALLASQTLIDQYNVSALIGALYSFETRISQLVSKIYHVPQIAATPLSTLLSNKVEYPYLVRVIPPDQYEAQAIADLFRLYRWKQAMVFYVDDEYGTYGLSNMVSYTKELNVTLYSNLVPSGGSDFSSNIRTIKPIVELNNIKIFIMYVQYAEAVILLDKLRSAGLIGGEYIYIQTFASALPFLMTKSIPQPGFVGSVITTPRGAIPGELYSTFMDLYSKYGTHVPNSQEDPGAAWYYVDAVYLIATAVTQLMEGGKELEHITGQELLHEISTIDFTGVTGRVILDDTLDRVGDYVWLQMTDGPLNITDIRAIYDPISKNTSFLSSLSWNNGITRPSDGLCQCLNGKCVDDVCVCNKDYSGQYCEKYVGDNGLGTDILIIIIVVPIIAVILIILLAMKHNRYKRTKMIKDISDRQRSVLKRSDITLKDRIGRGASGEVFKGMLRGTEVAVKKIVTSMAAPEVASDFELECAIMSGLRHPNIVLFMGSCFVPEQNEMLLVMELMERGSLHDILHNFKIQLTRDLLLNIAYQSAKGMNFLHQSSPAIIHRDLKSHNILMDDKWNARISDFGITKIKNLSNKKAKEDAKQKSQSLGTIYWTAPEVFEGNPHTESSDCYSFGVILWEMFHRQTPYGGREPMSVAMEVVTGIRPKMDSNLDKDIQDLITECWSGTPSERPDFETITNRLREMIASQGNLLTMQKNNNNNQQVEAPTGPSYFVVSEVEDAGALWDEIPMVMLKSIELHNKLMRSMMEKHGGYEVDFCHNGFFIVFSKLQDSINFCISVQKGLINVAWPAELLLHPAGKVILNGGTPIWAGLRVRMGLHYGLSNCEVDRATGRVTYFGPIIERTKKLVYAAKKTYPIVATAVIIDQCNKKAPNLVEEIVSMNCGEMMDTSRSKMEAIYKIFPKSLTPRENVSDGIIINHYYVILALPHSVVMVEEMEMEDGAQIPGATLQLSSRSNSSSSSSSSYSKKGRERAKWDISHESLEEKDKVGRGSTGDFVRCLWKGQEVAAKVLLNQKVEESDLLVLKARASVLSKLKHKNLLGFHGVCLDPGHVSVIVDYLPNSGLPSLLSDSSVPLKFNQKLKILIQLAEAIDYLNQSEQTWLPNFSLKSANVLIIREKEKMDVKLCDFGQGNLRDLARTMTSVGTVAWTAPEILFGEETREGDEAAKKGAVYSFGIISWEVMTREVPYHDQHPIKVVNKILSGYRPPFPADCPTSFCELVDQCWDGKPENRPSWSTIIHQLNTMQQ